MGGDSEGTSPSLEEVPDLVHNPSASASNVRGNRAELERLAKEGPKEYRKRIGQ